MTAIAFGKNINGIIPQPVSVILEQGAFLLDRNVAIVSFDKACNNSELYLRNYLGGYYNLKLKKKAKRIIELKITPNSSAVEGAYSLVVDNERVVIEGYNEQGLFYGVQTFIQLLPVGEDFKSEKWEIPAVKIDDYPQFPYRGMHLDVVRHIFPIEFIKKYIDYLALHKMNYFHWHLTDDQGWRMESKSHPLLNEKGAYRDATIIGLFPGTGVDSTRYGGYYTIAQMKEIVKYAKQRYITIVPEIDIPGHCMAVLATYPQLGTRKDTIIKPAITWGIYNRQNNVLAPSERTFKFLEDVFNELMDIFPGKYIHIGADECAHRWWKSSEQVQEFIAANNLKDEKGLQKYFAMRVNQVVEKRGRIAVGWDELIDNGLFGNIAVMAWRKAENGYKAAAQGHKVILTPSSYSYFNLRQRDDETHLAPKSKTLQLEKVYKFNPLPDSLSLTQKQNILGGQGCMWTEYYEGVQDVEYAIFPRISAMSELYWSSPKVKNWNNFVKKLPHQFARYNIWGNTYSSYIFEQKKQ